MLDKPIESIWCENCKLAYPRINPEWIQVEMFDPNDPHRCIIDSGAVSVQLSMGCRWAFHICWDGMRRSGFDGIWTLVDVMFSWFFQELSKFIEVTHPVATTSCMGMRKQHYGKGSTQSTAMEPVAPLVTSFDGSWVVKDCSRGFTGWLQPVWKIWPDQPTIGTNKTC